MFEHGADAGVGVPGRIDEVVDGADGAFELANAGWKKRTCAAVDRRVELLDEIPDAKRRGEAPCKRAESDGKEPIKSRPRRICVLVLSGDYSRNHRFSPMARDGSSPRPGGTTVMHGSRMGKSVPKRSREARRSGGVVLSAVKWAKSFNEAKAVLQRQHKS